MSNEQLAVAEQAAEAEQKVLDPAQVDAEKDPEPAQETAEQIAAREAEAEAKAEKRRERRERKEYYELKAKAEYLERVLERQQAQTQGASEPEEGEDILERVKQEIRQEYEIKNVEQKKNDVFKQARVDRKEFGEVVSVFTNEMAKEVLDSELAPKLVKHFYENPEEAERIAGLSPSQQAKEIWKLEQKIAQAPVVKKSGAPSPITPITGNKSGILEYSPDMSDEDYDRWTAEQHKLRKNR